jgi:polysaccharide deacetylase 2 family uncharacterized protein YibQ
MKKKLLFLVFLLPAVLFGSILVCLYVLNEFTDITVSSPGFEKDRLALHERQGAEKDTDETRRSRPERGGVRSERCRPRVAIIIDDIGQHYDLDLSFIKLDLPLSLAILPSAPFTDLMVREATRKGREILLHQPMEPKDYPNVKPGTGALLLSMNEHEIREVLDRNLTQVSGARGVNNHMGSSFTESREKMSMVVHELKRRGLFFIDSRTTKSTVGFEEAKKLGLPAGQRTVFLDNDLSSEAIWNQIEYLLRTARECGGAIGIGHPYHQTIDILKKSQNRLRREVDLVPASKLVR